MLAFDLPPPAIVQVRPALDLRLCLNGEEGGAFVPCDFLAMPAALRVTVSLDELRSWLPAEYRMVPDGLLAHVLYANLPGLPGVLMAGNIKKAWLYTANGQQFRVPGDWNKRDNIIHALGGGGNGRAALGSPLSDGLTYGGGGGGAAAWAALLNREFIKGDLLDMNIAGSSGSTWFITSGTLLADGGSNAPSVSGGDANGGSPGTLANSIGDLRSNGGRGGRGRSGSNPGGNGGEGGGAGGPNGDGGTGFPDGSGYGDAGFGGRPGTNNFAGNNTIHLPGRDGTEGISGGFNPRKKINAGSGGGGAGGISDADQPGRNGTDGGRYGAGGGGGGGTQPGVKGSGGDGAPGCLLIINNASK